MKAIGSRKSRLCIASIAGLVLIIAYLHHSTSYANPLQEIYAELHYVPVLLAALAFGFRGAALISVVIVVVYIPYLVGTWTGSWFSLLEHSIHILFPAFFGVLVGFLIDLERKRRREVEKSRYLAGIGQAGTALVHDLRNPVLTIEGFADRIVQGKGDARASAEAVVEAAQRIERIIDSVLNFAKPIVLDRQEEDVGRFVKDLCEREKGFAEGHGVEVAAVVPESEITASIDRPVMERALLNVITNAIEASKPGQNVVVSVSAKRNIVVITVQDNGEGMDRETRESLFVPFYSRKAKGTGLGMAIAKKIVEEHRGRIGVVSERGHGTSVSVTLPTDTEGPTLTPA